MTGSAANAPRPEELVLAKTAGHGLTHQLFRYPAKFHPPVVAALLERYTAAGQTVLDQFVGSGTALVESLVAGRHSIGVDIDPVAVLVSTAKVQLHDLATIEADLKLCLAAFDVIDRGPDWYVKRQRLPLGLVPYNAELAELEDGDVPNLPNIEHWFRRYVIVDLARMRRTIRDLDIDGASRDFLHVVFASIIRNASNADPVPVSGLEVTKHMLDLDEAGRVVDPFRLFQAAARKALRAYRALAEKAHPNTTAVALHGDATALPAEVPQVDAALTSPPYHNAVDYYRRHNLEMWWLGLVESHDERLALLQHYIGRPRIPVSHPLLAAECLTSPLAQTWEADMRVVSASRANDFKHYMLAMTHAFGQLASRLAEGAPALFVVGQSSWNGQRIPTERLFAEIAGDLFRLDEHLWYTVRNRYMSYARRNLADIGVEHVLVFRRTADIAPK